MVQEDTKQIGFTRFPNPYLVSDCRKRFGVDRKFYIIYMLLDQARSRTWHSWITIRKVLECYHYHPDKKWIKAADEVLDVLYYMERHHMISICTDVTKPTYDLGIEVRILPGFIPDQDFTKLPDSYFDFILQAEGNPEPLFRILLYLSYYLNSYSPILEENRIPSHVCWRSVETIARDLSMAKKTVLSGIDFLCKGRDGKNALLRKLDGEYKDRALKKFPTIYTWNQGGWETRLQEAKHYLLENWCSATENK